MIHVEKGTIYKIYPVESGTTRNGNQWANQRIIVDVPTSYNSFSHLSLKAPQRLLKQIADLHVGDKVEIQFIIESREWNDKWLNDNILMYIISDANKEAAPAPKSDGVFPPGYVPRQSPRAKFDENGDSMDLPF